MEAGMLQREVEWAGVIAYAESAVGTVERYSFISWEGAYLSAYEVLDSQPRAGMRSDAILLAVSCLTCLAYDFFRI